MAALQMLQLTLFCIAFFAAMVAFSIWK